MTGYLHEDQIESNQLAPIETIVWLQDVLVKTIFAPLIAADIQIHIVCNFGNHGRTTKRMRSSATAFKTSYEWLLYNTIAAKKLKNCTWQISKSRICYTTIDCNGLPFVLRTWHGDNIRFEGGIGGLTIPFNKLVARLDIARKADANIIGHWHTNTQLNPRSWCSGSVIGYNAYAHDGGFPFEAPKQTILLLDVKYREVISSETVILDALPSTKKKRR